MTESSPDTQQTSTGEVALADHANSSLQPTRFTDELIFSDLNDEFAWTKMYDLRSDPTKLVRCWGIGAVRAAMTSSRIDGGSPQEFMAIARDCLKRLEAHGVKTSGIPENEIFEDDMVYTVTHRVQGKQIDDALRTEDIPELMLRLDDTTSRKLTYYREVYQSGGPYLLDLDLKQDMYGTLVGSPESDKDVYMVDIDPIMQIFKKDDPSYVGTKSLINRCIDTAVQQALWLERASGKKMSATRAILNEILTQFETDGLYVEKVLALRSALGDDEQTPAAA